MTVDISRKRINIYIYIYIYIYQHQIWIHAYHDGCHWGQFRHTWARNVYGLPDDETMRMEDQGTGRTRPEDALSRTKTSVNCEFEHDGHDVTRCRVDDVEFLFWPRLPNNRAWFISELMYFFEEVPFWWERACNQSFSQTIVEWPDWDVVAFQQILALAWSLQATNRDCTNCSLPQVTLMSPIE